MDARILYDRVINITLLRDITPAEYRYSRVNIGKKTIGMYFYKGADPRILKSENITDTEQPYKTYITVPPSGKNYSFIGEDAMLGGYSASGDLLSTGDRILVTRTKETWTVLVEDDMKNTRITTMYPDTVYLDTTTTGIKPSVSLNINLLPGQNCYNAIVRVSNLNLSDTDIRTWTTMIIEAGYRTGEKVTFRCPIFTSYIETPNPDGITVFEGLIVGTTQDPVSDAYIQLNFHKSDVSLYSIVEETAKGLSAGLKVSDKTTLEKTTVALDEKSMVAENGLAIVSWLQTFLTETTNRPVFVSLYENILHVTFLDGEDLSMVSKERVISLDMVYGATFTGTALTVIAPWDPALKTGDLFYMPPNFITGSKLPNIFDASLFKNDKNLYRVLTMDIEFSTTGSTNKMTILAIPAQWAKEGQADTTDIAYENWVSMLAQDIANEKVAKQISYGSVATAKSKGNQTGVRLLDEGKKYISSIGWTTVNIGVRDPTLLKEIAAYVYDKSGGLKLRRGAKGKDTEGNYFRGLAYWEGKPKALANFRFDGCEASMVFWPLVLIATYWAYRQDVDNHIDGSRHSRVVLSSPNEVDFGAKLEVPTFSTWESFANSLTPAKDIWKYAYLEYKWVFPGLSDIWKTMYYYLGGTDDI